MRNRRFSSRSYSEDLNKIVLDNRDDNKSFNMMTEQIRRQQPETNFTSAPRRNSSLLKFSDCMNDHKSKFAGSTDAVISKVHGYKDHRYSQSFSYPEHNMEKSESISSSLPPINSPPFRTSRKISFLPDVTERKPSASSTCTSYSQQSFNSSPNLSNESLGRRSFSKPSVLVDSVKMGRVRHVQLLLSAGMDPNKKDEKG